MPKDQKKETKKDKPQGEKPGPKKTYPLTEEEKTAQAKVDKCEKQIEEAQAKVKDIMGKIHEKESVRTKLRGKVIENRDALNKIHEQMTEKRRLQSDAFSKAQRYIDALRKRRNRRADERAELMKLLPRGAELPPLREDEEGTSAVSDYDRAIKIVQKEIERIQNQHRISSFTSSEEKRMMVSEARWKGVITKIKELEESAAAPLADLAEVDVLGCLETCRKLKTELNELNDSCIPHYKEIADALEKLEENRTGVPKLLQERNELFEQVKKLVANLQEANFELDKARFKAQQARNQKRREEALKESETIKARIEEAKKKREARIEKAMNTLPHEREVAAANELLSYLRTIALPGTCGTSEVSAQPKPKAQPQQPTMSSAPAVELEEASFGKTEMVVSRKSQPVPKVAKKQNKKKKPAAAPAEPQKTEPKKKTLEDPVRVNPAHINKFEILSLSVPETYGDVEARYNEIKEKLEGFEKVRSAIREQREKSLQEAEKKAQEEAAAKKEETKEEEPKEEEAPKEEAPKEEEPAAVPAAETAESQ